MFEKDFFQEQKNELLPCIATEANALMESHCDLNHVQGRRIDKGPWPFSLTWLLNSLIDTFKTIWCTWVTFSILLFGRFYPKWLTSWIQSKQQIWVRKKRLKSAKLIYKVGSRSWWIHCSVGRFSPTDQRHQVWVNCWCGCVHKGSTVSVAFFTYGLTFRVALSAPPGKA